MDSHFLQQSQSNMYHGKQSMNTTSIISNDRSYKTSQRSYLNKLQKLIEGDPEFNRVQYELQMQLRKCNVKIKHIYNVGSDNKKQNFMKNSEKSQILESWLPIKNLDPSNKIEDIVNRGFQFDGSRGILFGTGSIQSRDLNLNGTNKQFVEMLVCNICPGRSQLLEIDANDEDLDKKILSIAENTKRNPNFDSFVVTIRQSDDMYDHQGIQQNVQNNQTGNQNMQYMNNSVDDEEQNDTYEYVYILYKAEQVHAQYIVTFEYDESSDDNRKQCDVCGTEEAHIYCVQDKAYFCDNCDNIFHEQMVPNNRPNIRPDKIAHKRIRLENKPMIYRYCHIHKDTLCELYCNHCKIPLCVYCKINGSHANGNDASNHQLRKIDDVYREAILESKDNNTSAERRKNILQSYLREIENKIQKIQVNNSTVEQQIVSQSMQAMEQLQEETNNKIMILMSDQREVKRQFEQLEYSESFLKHQQERMDPVDYLNNYNRHQEMREKLIQQQSACQLNYHTVKDDIVLEGNLYVISRNSQNRQPTSTQQKTDQMPQMHNNISISNSGHTNAFGLSNTIMNTKKGGKMDQFNNRDHKNSDYNH